MLLELTRQTGRFYYQDIKELTGIPSPSGRLALVSSQDFCTLFVPLQKVKVINNLKFVFFVVYKKTCSV